MRRLLFAALVAAGGCESAVIPPPYGAEAYEYRLEVYPPQVLRWPSGSTIRVFVAGDDAALRAALRAGAASWNAQALFGEYRLAETTDLGQADVVLRWSTESGTVDYSGCVPAVPRAVTTFCPVSDDLGDGFAVFPRTDGGTSRVKMLVSVLSSQPASALERLVAHELGHVLGIARHSSDSRDLMYGLDPQVAQPSRRDIATIRLLYQMQPQVRP